MANSLSLTKRRSRPPDVVTPRIPGGGALGWTICVIPLVCYSPSRRPSPSLTVAPRRSSTLTPPRATPRPFSWTSTINNMICPITLLSLTSSRPSRILSPTWHPPRLLLTRPLASTGVVTILPLETSSLPPPVLSGWWSRSLTSVRMLPFLCQDFCRGLRRLFGQNNSHLWKAPHCYFTVVYKSSSGSRSEKYKKVKSFHSFLNGSFGLAYSLNIIIQVSFEYKLYASQIGVLYSGWVGCW